jgi:hypothetical protein
MCIEYIKEYGNINKKGTFNEKVKRKDYKEGKQKYLVSLGN